MTDIDTSPAAIAAIMDGVTPGPWDWQVSRSTMTVELSGGKQTKAGGDLTVMSFARYGMRRAAPLFWTWDGLTATRVERADKLAIAVPGREHHAGWFARIDHPDARFIAAARDLVPALAAERDALRAENERLRETHPHSWYVVQEHFARRRADGLARELGDMRAKLQAANLRANSAEARANSALKGVANG